MNHTKRFTTVMSEAQSSRDARGESATTFVNIGPLLEFWERMDFKFKLKRKAIERRLRCSYSVRSEILNALKRNGKFVSLSSET